MMKKTNLLFMLFAMLIIASCSDDDDAVIDDAPNPPAEPAPISVVLNEIEYLGNQVEILNTGNETADINDFFLCLGPGTYSRIGALTNESATIAPGGFLVVTYDQLNSEAGQIEGQNGTGGLGLYSEGGAFGDPNTIVDYVQWGAAGGFREDVASQAGIWTVGDFIEVSNEKGTSIIYDGIGDAASDFEETVEPSFGEANGNATAPNRSIVLNEVEFLGSQVEILNTGNTTVDISGYFLCLGPQTYQNVGTLAGGSAVLAPGEFLVVNYDALNTENGQILVNGERQNATGGLGLYNQGGAFANPNTLMDFVQWGAAGSIREVTAVDAGIWTAGDFVEVTDNNQGTSIIFDGEGNTADDWEETTEPSFGEANGNAIAPNRSIVLNEVEYLDSQVEILNDGNTTVDISGYFLCLGPGTYQNVGTLAGGSAVLAPGEFLVVNYDALNTENGQILVNGERQNGTGGLGLYNQGGAFANPNTIVDFVQWGAAGSIREITAVDAGIWTAGDFIEVTNFEGTSIAFDGEGDTAADFAETAIPTFGADNGQAVPPVRSIVLNEVEYLGEQVEILNDGNVSADISGYFLCLGPGTYQNVGTLAGGSAVLAPGEFLVVNYNSLNTAAGQINNQSGTGGLGLYTTNAGGFGVAAADNLSDFVQWGAAGSIRENVAVAAGIWTAGEFVTVVNDENNSIAFDGEGDTAADFAETTTTTFGAENVITAPEQTESVVINEVVFRGSSVELFNNGDVTIDLSGYFLCLAPGTYRQIGSLPVESGNTTLAPGEFLVVTYDQLNAGNNNAGRINGEDGTGGLGLYTTNAAGFGGQAGAANLADFVQWGNQGSFREDVADIAGEWTPGDFVTVSGSTTNSIAFDGEGAASGDWIEGTPTLGAANK